MCRWGRQDGVRSRQHLPEGGQGQRAREGGQEMHHWGRPRGVSPHPGKCWLNLADPMSRLLVAASRGERGAVGTPRGPGVRGPCTRRGAGAQGRPLDDHRGSSVLGEHRTLEAPARKSRSENDAWRGPSCLVHARTFGSGPGGALAVKPPPAELRRPQEWGGRAGPSAESGAALPGRSPRCLGRSLLQTCPVVLFQLTGLHLIGKRETRK